MLEKGGINLWVQPVAVGTSLCCRRAGPGVPIAALLLAAAHRHLPLPAPAPCLGRGDAPPTNSEGCPALPRLPAGPGFALNRAGVTSESLLTKSMVSMWWICCGFAAWFAQAGAVSVLCCLNVHLPWFTNNRYLGMGKRGAETDRVATLWLLA